MEKQDAKYNVKIENANGETINIGDFSQVIHKGVTALTTLLSNEKIYNQVLVCSTDSQKISKQIDNLRIYKDIHDLLYRLEFNCYRGIALEAKRSILDNISIQTLIEHKYNLEQIIIQFQDIKAKANHESFTISWIEELEKAKNKLKNSIGSSDIIQLKEAVRIINRILNIHPNQINSALNSTAKNLNLSNLIDLMGCLLTNLANSYLESSKIEKFKYSVEALKSLRDKIIDIIQVHNDWQLIDFELRFFESNIYRGDYLEAKDSWSYLTEKITNKCISSQANLVNPIREYEKDLEYELFLDNPNINKLNYHSRSYRRVISDHLYNITNNVQALFNELQRVDNSLTLIINMTLHDGI